MSLINGEINHSLTSFANCVIFSAFANQAVKSTQDDVKLLQSLKSEFKRTINWNKYQSWIITENASNKYLHYSIYPGFQGVDEPFVLPFNVNDSKIGHSIYYLPTANLEEHNVMIDRKMFLIIQLKMI